ncbi:Fasciclin-domain-containing protein, partial [Paxillus ammoniavirescens]
LNTNGLTQLASIATSLNGTAVGQGLLSQLPKGNKTLFAPTNEALSALDPATASNNTLLGDIVLYHVVSGDFVNETQTCPNVTIGRTLLNDSALVTLEGNKSQVLAWSKTENGSTIVLNQGSNVTTVNTTTYNNTEIIIVNSVLIPPPNMTDIFGNASYELSALSSVLQSVSFKNGSSVLAEVTSARGITFFAPNNGGIQAAESTLTGLASNTTALAAVISNHIINGTSVYSPEITGNSSFVSAGGQKYAFSHNATGLFVSVGGSNAVQVVQTNVLAANGVIHIVNGVLVDTNTDPALASSAYASATAVAAQSATETGPVGLSPTPTPTPDGGGGGSGAAVMNFVPDFPTMGVFIGLVLVGQML